MAGPDISVVIATRDRARAIEAMLTELAHQDTGGRFTYDVVVVDNGSADDTAARVQRLAGAYPVALTLVREAQPGKPYAVNAGLAVARGGILALTDDDIVPDPAWLAGIWRALRETPADAVAGRILPLWVDGRPAWLTDRLMRHLGTLGCLDFGDARFMAEDYPKHFWWVGGNIAIRRAALERWGGYDARFVRGQDVELYKRYRLGGAVIVYEPSALVYHRIGQERLTPEFFRAWYGRMGYYNAISSPWQKYHLVTIVSVTWYREVLQTLAAWWRAGRSPAAFWERLGYECRLRQYAGQWWHRLRMWPQGAREVFTRRRVRT